jgi:hypothetical protein
MSDTRMVPAPVLKKVIPLSSSSPDGISVLRSRWSAFLMPEPLLDWLASKRMLTAPTLAFYAHTSEEAAGYRIIEYQKSR